MKTLGKVVELQMSLDGALRVTLELKSVLGVEELKQHRAEDRILDIEIKRHRNKRSLTANGMLWACLGEMAAALNADKWDIYLRMLRRYGKFTYIVVRKNAVPAMKEAWRECEEVGTIDINGQEAVQLLCYYGSHLYDSKEFSVLLDGVISEMREIGMTPPPSADVRAVLDDMRRKEDAEKKGGSAHGEQ